MKLENIINNIKYVLLQGNLNIDVSEICVDSRKVSENCMFVAIDGVKTNGCQYINEAITNGAKTVVVNNVFKDNYTIKQADITVIAVENTRDILSEIVNRFYYDPSEKFNLIGITGTNGKTSVATILNYIYTCLNLDCGLIGTIDNYARNKVINIEKTNPTTPDCVELGKIMNIMVHEHIKNVIMEVSSMALKLNRVKACMFDVGIFTNISPEHLDDHITMEDYNKSKLKLFNMVNYGVINVDDEFSNTIISESKCKIFKYGIYNKNNCDLYAEDIHYNIDSVSFDMIYGEYKKQINIKTPSQFAIYNILAAVGACIASGLKIEQIENIIQDKIDIPGRYSVINSSKGFSIIIDYAHTPVALENILNAVRNNISYNKIITVFGCGGDRDKTKRPLMGQISEKYSDYTFITSDNPRSEDPEKIVGEIVKGFKQNISNYEIEIDRRRAIEKAINLASKRDVIVISGKGHESYQILKDKIIDFDDKKIVEDILDEK